MSIIFIVTLFFTKQEKRKREKVEKWEKQNEKKTATKKKLKMQ